MACSYPVFTCRFLETGREWTNLAAAPVKGEHREVMNQLAEHFPATNVAPQNHGSVPPKNQADD